MNENIKKFLDGYMKNADPQYAVMLTGHWGCGKTFFINHWLEDLKTVENDREEIIYLKPIYVSLYGLSSLAEVKTEISVGVTTNILEKHFKFQKLLEESQSVLLFQDGEDA